MSAAVAEPVATKPKHRTFLARREGLRLVIKREQNIKDREGNLIETIPGQHLAFDAGRLIVPDSPTMKGEHNEQLDTAEVLKFLEGHSHNGDKFDGFWEHQEAAPAPSSDEQERLADLAMELDVAGLEAFIAAETAGWARPELLELAGNQLRRAKEKTAEIEDRVSKAREEGAATTKPQARAKPQE